MTPAHNGSTRECAVRVPECAELGKNNNITCWPIANKTYTYTYIQRLSIVVGLYRLPHILSLCVYCIYADNCVYIDILLPASGGPPRSIRTPIWVIYYVGSSELPFGPIAVRGLQVAE